MAALIAVTKIDPDGIVIGAEYKPELEIVPTVELPPAIPFTAQFTALFIAPVTLAANCCVCPTVKDTAVGVIET